MKIYTIAEEVYRELRQPSNISVASVAYWMQCNLGLLNTQIGTEYILDSSGEASPEIGDTEAAVFKYLYQIEYYSKKLRSNLGSSAYIPVTQISSEGVRMRKVTKTEIARTIANVRKELENELTALTRAYLKDKAKIAVISIYP